MSDTPEVQLPRPAPPKLPAHQSSQTAPQPPVSPSVAQLSTSLFNGAGMPMVLPPGAAPWRKKVQVGDDDATKDVEPSPRSSTTPSLPLPLSPLTMRSTATTDSDEASSAPTSPVSPQNGEMVHFKRVRHRRQASQSKRSIALTDFEDSTPIVISQELATVDETTTITVTTTTTSLAPPERKTSEAQSLPKPQPPGLRVPPPLNLPNPPSEAGRASAPSSQPVTPSNASTAAASSLPRMPPPPPISISTPSNQQGVDVPPSPSVALTAPSSLNLIRPPPLNIPKAPTGTSTASPTAVSPSSISNSTVFRNLQHQVAQARYAQQQRSQIINDRDNLTVHLPSFFQDVSPILPNITRSADQIFMIGPVGASQKKEFKSRWGILFRDRFDIYNKYGDNKPWVSYNLGGCLVSSNMDANGSFISLTNVKGDQLYIRAEQPTSTNSPTPNSIVPLPDSQVMHKAWFSSLRMRCDALEYVLKCKEQGITYPDDRVMLLFDAQVKSPMAAHMLTAFCPPNLYSQIASIPTSLIVPSPIGGVFPTSQLPVEGYICELSGDVLSNDALLCLCRLFNEPDGFPLFGVKFGTAPIDVKAATQLITALTTNSNSALIQIDVSEARWLSNATENSHDAIECITKLFTSTVTHNLSRITMKSSDLSDGFIHALTAAIDKTVAASSAHPNGIQTPLQVFDISHNKISDAGVRDLIGLFATSECISNHITHLNISFNPITDVGMTSISNWLSVPKPTTSQSPGQSALAPFKPIFLTHLYLQGLLISDKGAVAVANALLWHTILHTLDLSLCTKLTDSGYSALTHLAQINESLEFLRFGHYRLTSQGLTALRLFYRFGTANEELFGGANAQTKFSLVGLASEYSISPP